MKIIVTGATGFVGQHLVRALLVRGHQVVAVARSLKRARSMLWFNDVDFFAWDIHCGGPLPGWGSHDALIHLAWPGLPNYSELFHFERNLPGDYDFLSAMIKSGTPKIMVTGTCLEYGMQNGMLSEDMPTMPNNPYALAKDTLRRYLMAMQTTTPFILQWVRLFCMYGEGQSPNSLFAQLDRAIERGDLVFNMSGGEQLRDYLPVEEVVRKLALLIERPDCNGIFNCCSDTPISVRRLVEERVAAKAAYVELNLGYYPYPDYEPMAFWGDTNKTRGIF